MSGPGGMSDEQQIARDVERETVAAIVAWLRTPDMNGRVHTHTLAKELERGDWKDNAAEPHKSADTQEKA